MNRLQLVRTTGSFLIGLVVMSNIPYLRLIQTFGYDDILREPVDYVLAQFQAGGTALILTWFVFGLAALLLIPASLLLHQVVDRPSTPYLGAATTMGALSGLLQAIGLMRWVFVVPVLAELQTNPATDEATRAAVGVAYRVVHQYGGVIIGEQLGQLLLVGWTVGLGLAIIHSPLFKPWIGWWGLLTAPLLLLGQSELLATVIPNLPVIESTPMGFILWEVWLLLVGLSLLRVPSKRLVTDPFHPL
ncbi:DUF4386 domain-containing protein [Leptolyngbya sp. CCNP1308]|uniref:DUF4386 domain-containing protein n=1 Tax=Leptolyngbya sp. CCNP1308 TaxID=3110255 RepID=UPI002B21E389|nr:DUF4386 domain-containing protein [Leptolyngbya sp. CCNP1308]MEA5450100.1 DUF4386 domain-containing protein [Leptolyngbya sp. CCNP1308]